MIKHRIFISFISLLVIILFSSCAVDSYQKDMENGKNALREKRYDEAISYFENALIEKPTEKDALALLERAKESYAKEKERQKIESFLNQTTPIYERSMQILENFDVETITVAKAENMLPNVTDMIDQANSIYEDYEDSKHLLNGLTHIKEALEAIIEDIVEAPRVYTEEDSKYQAVRDRHLIKDSKKRATFAILDAEYEFEKHKQKIKELNESIQP